VGGPPGRCSAPCRIGTVSSYLVRHSPPAHGGGASNPADRDRVPLNTCYVIAAESADQAGALAAWLNSTWMRAAARAVADPARGGFARFNARVVGSLPLPPSVPDDSKLAHLARLGAQGAIVQDAIDAHCAELLDLPQSARETLASVATAGGRH
jgi:hypothetical protein